jgi:DegV family protein with EDD domain
MAIRIVTDGSADLPKNIVEELKIIQVPLSVNFKNEQLTSEMDSRDFYSKMKMESELPQTSSPAPYAFYERFQAVDEDDDIVCITLSSRLSGTYNNALIAKNMIEEEFGSESRQIHVIDSKNTSLGLGLLVYRAVQMCVDGCSLNELLDGIKGAIPDVKNYFVLDTLENVVKGGRLDRVRGAIAATLNIKLIMKASEEGTLEVLEKVRGSRNALRKMIEKFGGAAHHAEKRILGIAHSNCEEKAREILQTILAKYPFKEVIFTEMGPVIGVYAGEGAILVACS